MTAVSRRAEVTLGRVDPRSLQVRQGGGGLRPAGPLAAHPTSSSSRSRCCKRVVPQVAVCCCWLGLAAIQLSSGQTREGQGEAAPAHGGPIAGTGIFPRLPAGLQERGCQEEADL